MSWPCPTPHVLTGGSQGPGQLLVPSRVAPEVSALADAFRPRRREECSRVISSEAEKRLRSGPSRPARGVPDGSSGLGSSVLRCRSWAACPGPRKTSWAWGLPVTSSRWYTRILRPVVVGHKSTGWHLLGSLPTPAPCCCPVALKIPGSSGPMPRRKADVSVRIWTQGCGSKRKVGPRDSQTCCVTFDKSLALREHYSSLITKICHLS